MLTLVLLVRAALPAAAGQDVLVLRAGLGAQAAFWSLPGGDRRAAHKLPLGLLDRTGHTLYVAFADGIGHTLIRAIDVVSGRILRAVRIAGSYSTHTGDYRLATPLTATASGTTRQGLVIAPVTPAAFVASRPKARPTGGVPADTTELIVALSFSGRWLALRDTTIDVNNTHMIDVNNTHMVVLDTASMQVVRSVNLSGQFGLDAISSDGTLLYLIEPLYQYAPDAYQVRSYQVQRGILDAAPVIERGEKPGSMNGTGWTRVWSPEGSWLFTLYVQQSGNAFIHALNLRTRQVHCIDLPHLQATVAELAHYTLSMAPDGRSLYAVNPILGRLVVHGGLPYGSISIVDLKTHASVSQRQQAGAAITINGPAPRWLRAAD